MPIITLARRVLSTARMRVPLASIALVFLSCSHTTDSRRPDPDRSPPRAEATRTPMHRARSSVAARSAPTAAATTPTRGSLRVTSIAEVRAEPRVDAEILGVVAIGERVRATDRVEAPDCPAGWLAIEPRGHICADVEPDDRPPTDDVLPRVSTRRLVPGVYGKLRAGAVVYDDAEQARHGFGRTPEASLTVRKLGSAKVGKREYWKTRHGLVDPADVKRLRGSAFEGTPIGTAKSPALPVAWVRFRGDDGAIDLRAAPSPRAAVTTELATRERLPVTGFASGDDFVHLADRGWAARDDVRVAVLTTPPEGVGTDDRWIDIDVDEQTLVAYQGTTAVFATLVSTGRRTHDTPIGTFRIERKVAERTMVSLPASDDEPYAVDKVPWTAYFAQGYALHAAYWHGGFGERRSHGCVNLSPADARALYLWSAPAPVPGWSDVRATSGIEPGSVVRIRDGAL